MGLEDSRVTDYQADAELDGQSSHAKLVALVPAGASVLDVGCAAGVVGQALAGRGCTVDGVDRDPRAAELSDYRTVWTLDLDRDDLGAVVGERRYDRVLLADVVEHLVRDRDTLATARELLAPEGRVVVSVPNAGHVSLRLELLRGDLARTARGLLDRTHLRFYTRASFTRLAAEAGLAVERIEATESPLSEAVVREQLAACGLEATPAALERLRGPDAAAYQWLFVLRPLAPAEQPDLEVAPDPLGHEAWHRAALEVAVHEAQAARQAVERELDRLHRTRAMRWAHGWWRLQARARRVQRLVRGPVGSTPTARLGRAVTVARSQGVGAVARSVWETVWGSLAAPGWDRPHPPADGPPPALPEGPAAPPQVSVVVVPRAGADLRPLIASLRAQSCPAWELLVITGAGASPPELGDDARVRHVAGAGWQAGLAAAAGDWILALPREGELGTHAVAWLVHTAAAGDHDVIYADEDALGPNGRQRPRFKPQWSPELLLSTPYTGDPCAVRAALAHELGGYRDGFGDLAPADLVLRAGERARGVARVPRILFHAAAAHPPGEVDAMAEGQLWRRAVVDALARRGQAAEVEVEPYPLAPAVRVRRELLRRPRVSVIVPTRDRVELLGPCLASLRERSTYPDVDVLVVDNGSTQPAALALLAAEAAAGRLRVLRDDGPFDFARLMNRAAAEAEGEVLVFLNNDTEIRTPGWLEALLEHALRPDVGAVGARLLFPDGTLQHGGVVLGLGAGAGHLHLGAAGNAWGYLGRARLAGEFSAVTAACLAVERSKFDAVGGFDPRGLRINYGDVDLCLRLGQRGWRTIYTPYAVLTHRESASRSKAPDVAEAAELARRWPALLADDPHYSPHLSRLRADGVWDPPGD